MRTVRELTVGIGGFGTIGGAVARALHAGVPGLRLAAVSARNAEAVRAALPGDCVPVVDFPTLAARCDIVVEAMPRALFGEVALPAVEAGRTLVVLSAGALLDRAELIARAEVTGARIVVPSGAILGLDAVRAAAEGPIASVTIEMRKPPGGWKGAPYVERSGIDMESIVEPTVLFEGSARDGAAGFPANVNVAAALALAGIGPDRTRLRVIADPTIERNTHTITVDAECAQFSMTIAGVPSPQNPRTGKIVALSTLAALRSLVAPLRIGT